MWMTWRQPWRTAAKLACDSRRHQAFQRSARIEVAAATAFPAAEILAEFLAEFLLFVAQRGDVACGSGSRFAGIASCRKPSKPCERLPKK